MRGGRAPVEYGEGDVVAWEGRVGQRGRDEVLVFDEDVVLAAPDRVDHRLVAARGREEIVQRELRQSDGTYV